MPTAAAEPTPEEKAAPTREPSQETAFEKRIGISTESLRAIFEKETLDEKPKMLRDLLAGRLRQTRIKNFAEYPIYAAIDTAYNIAFDQTTTTLVNSLLARNWGNDKDLLETVKQWGLDEDRFFRCTDCNGSTKRTRRKQSLSRINIPLVKSFITIRLGKLFNDRNQYPLLKYEPILLTADEMAVCEIITQLVQRIVAQYGYHTYLKQTILQTLLYSYAFMFPQEVWHVEEGIDENGDRFAKREGIRYHVPHPTRVGYDLNYMPSTFNTDTGCEWACYWRVCPLRDIQDNPYYFNTQKVPIGTNWFAQDLSGAYFTEYHPCQAKPPRDPKSGIPNDREDAASYYVQADRDKAVFLTDMFAKIVPKTYGIGDLDIPVWFRFVIASDDNIVWAEPCPYAPIRFCGYDFDENRGRNPSMALEILPSQDQLSNIQSQIIGAVKQNLKKIIPFDTDQVPQEVIEKLKEQGENLDSVQFLPFSSKMAKVAGVDPSKMFNPIQFPLQPTVELIAAQNSIVSNLERLLGMSSNEVGAAGVHVQTAEEIRVINTNISNRLEYTGHAIDAFMQAWKVQLYEAVRAFMDEEFIAQVTASPDYIEPLKKLGFELGETFDGLVQVKGSRSKLVVEGFISQREGQNRINQPQVAQVMMQTLQAAAANPLFLQALGPEQFIDQLNRAAQLAGAPKDFKLKVQKQVSGQPGAAPEGSPSPEGAAPGQNPLAQVAQQIQQGAVKISMEMVQKGLEPLVQRVDAAEKVIQQIGEGEKSQIELLTQLKQAVEMLAANQAKIMQAATMAPPMPVPADVPPTPAPPMPPAPAPPPGVPV